MKRNFKALGLVLAAVFAMSAMGATAASAAEFHSAAVPNTLSGSQSTTHVFTTSAGKVTCTTATFSGTATVKTTKTQTLTPNYKNCTAFGFINVPIHTTGCAYIFHTEPSKVTVECATTSGVPHTIKITVPGCTTEVGAQELAGGMTYTNNAGKTDIVAHTNMSGITYNECGTVRNNGTYTGTTTITGTSAVWYE